ncbi:hypothetical protein [Cellulomonas sp. KRMCY2]|uniref:hypothetical protein n=1 Tax=Cellulomonas sp. KRMCY2 TaxID=1304865 RepID=UPI0004B4E09B|nr:hypothetical protein [Cellulomonas sp. KRMCY2]
MSAAPREAGSTTDPTTTVCRAGGIERALELVLAGLARDEDELLGDLAEGRAEVASAQGERAARRWWLAQALRAAPSLAWHELVHRPAMLLLGLAGFVLWVWMVSLAYAPSDEQAYDFAHPVIPSVSRVIRDTVVVGTGNLLAAAIVGAAVAALARRVRLVPALVPAALMALISSRHAFYIAYRPGTCTISNNGSLKECSLELGAWSRDVVVPVLWQLPTMMILLPLATALGGLAVIAWSRRRQAKSSVRPPAEPGPA